MIEKALCLLFDCRATKAAKYGAYGHDPEVDFPRRFGQERL